uniref:Alpha-endosulfine n=1 Tax=Strigamia maritima TaxID=126957 RepID=T1JK59_STRMM
MSNEDQSKRDEATESSAGLSENTPEDEPEISLQKMEQIEEAKLKSRYPQAVRPGGSSFLQKRLNKGQKYFDSGDYNMAKAKGGKSRVPILQQPTGEAIPTPDNLPTRKTSLVQSKLAAGLS